MRPPLMWTDSVPPDEARARATEILSRPEFRPPEQSWFDRAREWVGNAIGRLLSALFEGGAGSAVTWALLAVAVAVIVLIAIRIGRTVQRDPVRRVRVEVERHRDPADWRAEAARLEAEGRWKAALRCRYRALVADLVRRDVVRDVPGRTTGEYRAEVAEAAPTVAGDFAGASELFERAWYGDLPTGADESDRFRELADRVVGGVGR